MSKPRAPLARVSFFSFFAEERAEEDADAGDTPKDMPEDGGKDGSEDWSEGILEGYPSTGPFGDFRRGTLGFFCDCSPPAARSWRICSSRTILRLKITPSFVLLKTPDCSSSLRRAPTSFASAPTMRPNSGGVMVFTPTLRCPYGVPSCMRFMISSQSPRAANEHD